MKVWGLTSILIVLSISVFAGSPDELIKKGWNFGVLPAVSFDSDLGFQYGGIINFFNFGDGSRYPDYNHSLYLEVSRYTKGSGVYRLNYDSDRLWDGIQTSVDLSYQPDLAYDFYGFNGYDAVYNESWTDEDTEDYISRMYYKYDNKLFRFKVDLNGNLAFKNLKWLAGVQLLNFKIGSVDIEKLNKGKSEDELLPDVGGLYEQYVGLRIIPQTEANGGFVPTFKAGLVYDTRNNKSNPMKGIWSEVSVEASPEFLGGKSTFARMSIYHRQYFTLKPERLSLAFRLNYQTKVAGHVPFYYQSQVISSVLKSSITDGLGGANTLRGVLRNRVVGDGYFMGNLELRWKSENFTFINNNFYIGLVGFSDFGRVTKKINFLIPKIMSPEDDYFDKGKERLHFTYGAGLRIAMNENFIVRIDYGKATDKRDGNSGLYMGLNYLF